MSSLNRPSIFTSRESFKRSIAPPRTPTPTGIPQTSPELRRQSTPEAIEKNRIQAAAEAATFVHISPEDPVDETGRASGVEPAHPATWSSVDSGAEYPRTASPGLPAKGRSVSEGNPLIQTPPREHPPRAWALRSTGDFRKRHIHPDDERGPTSEPSKKRQKVHVRQRSKHYFDSSSLAAAPFQQGFEPPSPLFFSNSPRPRPTLPPRFSSSEAGAKMLSRARLEDSHMKTVSLARGIVTTPTHPNAAQQPTSAGRASSERRMSARSSSPDLGGAGKEAGHILNSVGITELLEQDERPVFIIDLGARDNYGPGPLEMLYANPSLRSYPDLEALVTGRALDDTSPGPAMFIQFKSWLMSAAVNGESLDVCLPSFVFANLSWSCSTLRKKLRIISGAFLATPSSGRELRSTNRSSKSTDLRPVDAPSSAPTYTREPSDYFGNAVPPALNDPSTIATEALPSIEHLPSADSVPMTVDDATIGDANDNLVQSDPGFSAPADLLMRGHKHVPSAESVVSVQKMISPDITPLQTSDQIVAVASNSPFFDWTRLPVSDSMPMHIQFARSVDWGATALGPIETWSSDLRQMCNLIMASPHPAAMYWGDDLIAIYNEAYVMLAGQKHPKLMGTSYRVAWAEIWDEVKDVFDSAQTTGDATMKDDDCLFIKRSNHLEETYFSWSIIPIVGKDGSVRGLYNPAFEKTRRKIAERRMLTLREVGERTASAREVRAFWPQVLSSFDFNESDSPFLLLYSVSDENESDSSSINSSSASASRQCILEGKLGVPDGHPAAPDQIDLKSGTEGFGPVFRDVMRTDKPAVLEFGSRDLPESLVHGLGSRGFGDPVRSVVVCPIHLTIGESILGFLVLGVNPRRPYDDDYSLFVQLLSRQLATSLASVVLFEEEIRRGQKAARLAALDRIELSEKLALRTIEAEESETKFTRMAEFAPVGMVIADANGEITFANETWYEISGVPKHQFIADSWMEYVNPEDRALVEKLWEDVTVRKKLVSSEFRFKAQWQDRSGTRGDTWVLFSGYPEKTPDGELKSVFASITNITQQKWAEGIQKRKMEEAVELKRQQENFIDITSHEMRNPLSAILQCSDEIANSLTKLRQSNVQTMPEEVLTSCLDAAQIISLCSQHQKRIVDDILTLSKLDSQLLMVTPVDAQPLTVVQRALKMHESELQAADIQMKLVVDQTYKDLELDWVRIDPSRALQVLINLTTNAIKFTGTESKRTITVTISAGKERPHDRQDTPVKYFPTRRKTDDLIAGKDWGDGEILYIHFAVRDTGRGLSPEEKKLLFMRFSQASPRTHVQYGGSGLGLFISRELTEMQGGEIGVESETGKGSTFAFYIVARRSSPPQDTDGATGLKRSDSLDSKREGSPPGTAGKPVVSLAKAGNLPTNGAPIIDEELVKRVLIIEDNLINQSVLQKQLKNVGTEVHLANHGGEALEKLQQSTYWADANSPGNGKKLNLGVLLMDQEMPVMDGLTCTRKIRELEEEGKLTGHVPIIAVTANARPEQVQTALDAGMDDVVSKPFRIPELVPKIEELLQRYPAPSA